MQALPKSCHTVTRTCILIFATTGAMVLGGCVSDPAPEQMSRTAVQTAPADLQLLCANAVATSTGAASDKVLPVSSRQLDSNNFVVELDAAGRKTSCIVDNDGNVKSVQPI